MLTTVAASRIAALARRDLAVRTPPRGGRRSERLLEGAGERGLGIVAHKLGNLRGTGDVGHLDENDRLFIDGRIDEMIVSGGENVYPIEVEDVIAIHEGVYETAVIGVDDEQFGARLMAFVVPNAGHEVDEGTIKSHVKSHLANFKVHRDTMDMRTIIENFSPRRSAFTKPEDLKTTVVGLLDQQQNIFDELYSLSYHRIPHPLR